MSDQTKINNWFTNELVAVTDMQPVNALMLSTLFSSNKPGSVFGIVPTIDTGLMTFATTSGFAFFGVTANSTYIANTGATTAACTVPSQGSIPLVDLNCFIYIEPIFTSTAGNRATIVTGNIYSSTNAADVGIKICQVVSGIATNYNNNNLLNYYNFASNIATITNPDGSPINIDISGTLTVNKTLTASSLFRATYNNGISESQISNGVSSNTSNLQTVENSTNNYAQMITQIDSGTHVAFCQLGAATAGTITYAIQVPNNKRPNLVGNVLGIPGGYDIVAGANLPFTTSFTVNDSVGNVWTLICTDLSGGGFPSNKFTIEGTCTYSYFSGTASRTIDLITNNIASGNATISNACALSFFNPSLYSTLTLSTVNTQIGNGLLLISTQATPGDTAIVSFNLTYK